MRKSEMKGNFHKKQLIPKYCKYGHKMTPENQYLEKKHDGVRFDRVRCRTCLRISSKLAHQPNLIKLGFKQKDFQDWSKEHLNG